jgi:nucleoside-diphosphate-sugar epimerase
MNDIVLITGSSGFLGSAICVDLARDHRVIGVDLRWPDDALKNAAPGVQWERTDIANNSSLEQLFSRIVKRHGRIDFIVHFAAFYDFEKDWHWEYERVNVKGMEHLIRMACDAGVRRLIFAGSIASLDPPLPDAVLNEKTPAGNLIPYSRSKAEGEALLKKNSFCLPSVVLRIGGVFSDWCELPPLYSLIRQWSQPGVLGRFMPGKGRSGFPFIHRKDLVYTLRRILQREKHLDRYEVLFAAPDTCTLYKDLYPIVRNCTKNACKASPIHLPHFLIRLFIQGKTMAAGLMAKQTYERTWMLKYLDKPFITDTRRSHEKIGWIPGEQFSIQKRIPIIMDRFHHQKRLWEKKNILRNQRQYLYTPD